MLNHLQFLQLNIFLLLLESWNPFWWSNQNTLGSTILSKNIYVPKLALDNEKLIFPKNGRREITRIEIIRHGLPDSLKIGRFSKLEDQTIFQNWEDLLKEANMENQPEDIMEKVFSKANSTKEDRVIKILIGYTGCCKV